MGAFQYASNRIIDSNGVSDGASIYFYQKSSTTKITIYSDAGYTTPISNPVVVPVGGAVPDVFWNYAGDVRVTGISVSGATLFDHDPWVWVSTSSTIPATSVTTKRAESGAITLTLDTTAKLRLDAAAFGVTGTGTETSFLQDAINAASLLGMDLYLPTSVTTGALTVPANVGIIGQSKKTTITTIAGSYNTFTIQGSNVNIQNLNIVSTAKSGGWDFIIACGTTQKDGIFLRNIMSTNSKGFLTDSGSGSGVHTTTILEDIQARGHNGPGIALTRGFAFMWFIRVVVDYVGQSNSNYTGFSFDLGGLPAGAGGLNLIDCDVLGTQGVFVSPNQRGFDIRNTAAVWVTNSRADTVCEIGWLFFNVNLIDACGLVSSLTGSHAVWLETVTNAKFRGAGLFGRNYLASPTANVDGFRVVSGCAQLSISGSLIRDFTGHGVDKVVAQAGTLRVSDNGIFNNTGRGVKSVGNSATMVVNNQFSGNTAGNYDLSGNSDYLVSCQLASGAVTGVLGPGPITG